MRQYKKGRKAGSWGVVEPRILRSTSLEALDGHNETLLWCIGFVHACEVRAGEPDTTICQDQFARNALNFTQRLWLQKTCGCAVTLSPEHRHELEQTWAVQDRLTRSVQVPAEDDF